MKGLRRGTWLGIASLVLVALAAAACGETKEVVRTVEVEKPVIVEKEVIKEIPVERIVEKPVVQVVEKQVVVTKEVVREVPVEKQVVVTKEVVREVPKEVVVTKEVVKEVVKEVIKEVPAKAKEKVLRVRMARTPPAFQPHVMADTSMILPLTWMYSGLVQPNPKDQKWEPNLAERWEVTPDFTSWTFFLNKSAVWHDGKPITSKDVAFTVKSFLNPGAGVWMPAMFENVKGAPEFLAGKASDVPGVVIVDDRTVKFNFSAPAVGLLETWHYFSHLAQVIILPAHLLEKIPPAEILRHQFWVDGLVGSGPFKFVQRVPDQFMEFKANDDYYLGRPKIDRILLSVIPSVDAAQIALQRGQIDVNPFGLPGGGNTVMLNDPRFDVYATQATHVLRFAFNGRFKETADPRFRQAWLYALDRQKLIDRFDEGLGSVVNTALINPWFQKPEWNKQYPYDPAKAKALLKEMGWDSNRVVKVATGIPTDELGKARLLAEVQMLADVGIKIEYFERSPGKADEWRVTHTAEVFRGGLAMAPSPAGFLSFLTAPLEENEYYYNKPELNALIAKAASESNQIERIKLYQQINEDYLLKDLPLAGMSQTVQVHVKNKRFVMPNLGDIPKPDVIGKIKMYPVFAGTHDYWFNHVEQWDLIQ